MWTMENRLDMWGHPCGINIYFGDFVVCRLPDGAIVEGGEAFPEQRAIADLIVTAPELLEALTDCVSTMKRAGNDSPSLAKAETTIAKVANWVRIAAQNDSPNLDGMDLDELKVYYRDKSNPQDLCIYAAMAYLARKRRLSGDLEGALHWERKADEHYNRLSVELRF